MSYSSISTEKSIVIEVNNISKFYSLTTSPRERLREILWPKKNNTNAQFVALKNINFNLHKGQTIGIIGRNGSGKSTLLQIICGVLEPSEGHIRTNGRIAAMLELGAGFNPSFTGRENIIFNAALMGLTKKEIQEKFHEIEQFADIGKFIDQPVRTYSSGMYARLAFAVSINVTPDILVIDEALAVGDEVFQRKCFAKIEEIKNNGATILFVSHSGSAIINLCDRAILLHQGELLYDGAPKRGVYYLQKIGNALARDVSDIVQEIKTEWAENSNTVDNTEKVISEPRQLNLTNHESIKEELSSPHEYKEFFDPSLNSYTSSSYIPRGASITSVKLMSLEGEIVNYIITGRRYKLSMQCEFHDNCESVRAYALIRTMDGIDLAGCAYPGYLNSCGIDIKKGTSITFDFEFNCQLNENTYFCNFALQAQDGSLHHRVVDALAFKVTHPSIGQATGLVDLKFAVTLISEQEKIPGKSDLSVQHSGNN